MSKWLNVMYGLVGVCVSTMAVANDAADVDSALTGVAHHEMYSEGASHPTLKLGVHLWSKHFPDNLGYENRNMGMYVQRGDWLAGTYHNSERRQSWYVGYQHRLVADWPIYVTIGAISGYRPEQRVDVLPLVAPSIKLPVTREVSVGVTVLPKLKGVMDAGVAHLTVEYALN